MRSIKFSQHVVTLEQAMQAFQAVRSQYLSFMIDLKATLIPSDGSIDQLLGEPHEEPRFWFPLRDRVTLSQLAVDAVVTNPPHILKFFTRRDFADTPREWDFSFFQALEIELEARALFQLKNRKSGLFVPHDTGEPAAIRIRVPHR